VSGPLDTRRVWTNAASLGFGEVAARGFSFIATLHLARVLGAANFGRIELSIAVVLYASSLATFGLDLVGSRHVAVDPQHARALVRTIISVRLALACVATLLLLVLTYLVPRFAEIRILLMLTAALVFVEATTVNWVFQGLERMRRVAVAAVLGQAAYAAGVLALVHGPGEILRTPLLSAAGSAVTAAVLAIVAWRSFRHLSAEPLPGLLSSLWREAVPVTVNAFASLVVYNAAVVIVGLLADDRHVGLYRAAGRIAGVFTMVGAAYSTAVFPSLARAARDPVAFRRTLDWTLKMSVAAWAVAAAAVIAGAHLILRFSFGRAYEESVFVLRLLILAAAVVGVRTQYRSSLIALKRAPRNIPPTLWAAAVNLGGCLFLIPRFGLRGAAWATILAETVMFFLVRGEVERALARPPA